VKENGRPEGSEGLAAIVTAEETLPLLRAIAAVAIRQGETLGSLAKKINEQDGGKRNASNVRAHLRSEVRPSKRVIEMYARALNVDIADLQLYAGVNELSPQVVRKQVRLIRRQLRLAVESFDDLSIDEAISVLDSSDATALLDIAGKHRRAEFDFHKVPEDALIEAFDGVFDLRSRRRLPTRNEDALLHLWFGATARFGRDDAESLVALGVGLLRRRGVDTAAMEDRLAREIAALSTCNMEEQA